MTRSADDTPPPAAEPVVRRSPAAAPASPQLPYARIVAITLGYAVVASTWILVSDRVVETLFRDPEALTLASMIKGWAFVAVTSVLLFVAMLRLLGARRPADAPALRWRVAALPLVVGAAALAAVSIVAIVHAIETRREAIAATLNAIVVLKVAQTEAWLHERGGDARFAKSSRFWADAYRGWREHNDAGARDRLVSRLESFRQDNDLRSIVLLDPGGTALWSSAPQAAGGEVPAALRTTAREASRSRSILLHVGAADDAGQGIDFVVPLDAAGTPAPVIVLRTDPARQLFPLLKSWPTPSASGRIALVRRDGSDVVVVTGAAAPRPPAAPPDAPPDAPDPLYLRAARNELPAGALVDDVDARGSPLVAMARPVAGTDWTLIAALERAEAYAPAIYEAAWILATSALLTFIVGAGLLIYRQRQKLAVTTAEHAANQQRLHALELLHAVAESSSDIIFAKDLAGRYVVFNGAGARAFGKSAAAVLGRDEHALYPLPYAERVIAATRAAIESGQTATTEDVVPTVDGARRMLVTRGPLRDAEGRVTGSFGIAHDITARIAAETALREREELYSTVVSQALDATAVVDVDTLRFIEFNAAAHDGLGYSRDEFAQLSIVDLNCQYRRATLERFFAQPLGPEGWVGETRHRHRSGEVRQVQVRARDIELRGRRYRAATWTDITERKRAEEALQREARRRRELMENSRDGIAILDQTHRVVEANQRFAEMLGYRADEVLQLHTWDFDATMGEAEVRARFADLASVHALFETRHRRRDGSTFDVEVSANGALVGGEPMVFTVCRDISERKWIQRAMTESEGRYRTLAESSQDWVWTMDMSGRHVFTNSAGPAAMGYTIAEFEALDPRTLVHADDLAAFDRELAGAKAAQRGWTNVVLRWRAKGGDYVEFESNAAPLFDAAGRLSGFQGIDRDVTERRRNAAALAESELRYRTAFRISPDAISINRLDDGRFVDVNEGFERMTGIPRDEALGARADAVGIVVEPADSARVLDALARNGECENVEVRLARPDGSRHTVLVSARTITLGGHACVLSMIRDITAMKRSAEELDRYRHRLEDLVADRTAQLLEARVRAEAASRAKSTFIANMSHEIRTPMNAIMGLTHLMQRAEAAPAKLERLRRIDAAARHLLAIINDILDLSKIEAGKFSLDEQDFTLDGALEQVRALVADEALSKGLRLHVDAGAEPLWLRGDRTRLIQALLNYAGNAVKFTEHGSITIRARALPDGGERLLIRFEVQDTGIGVEPQKIPLLFEAFEQGDSSTTRKYGGSGLGLAITRRFARLMGGDAGATSAPGAGSTFWFTARLSPGQPVTPAADPGEAGAPEGRLRLHRSGARVLVAEDDATNREVARELLEGVGFVVDAVPDGERAVEKYAANAYDLVLMDVQMPGMNGLAATRAIRQRTDRPRIPVLAMTANVYAEDRRACADAGMDDFVAKPVNPEALYAIIAHWLLPRGAAAPAAPADSPDVAAPDAASPIEGVDWARGVQRMSGDATKFRRLLHLFADTHGDDERAIAELLGRDDREGLRRLVHALKGAAGSIGATALLAAAATLESALRSGAARPEIEIGVGAVTSSLSRLITAIRRAPTPEAPAAVRVDGERLDTVVGSLAALLRSGDTQAQTLAREEAGLLRAAYGSVADDILARIASFDYEGAAAELDSVAHPPAG